MMDFGFRRFDEGGAVQGFTYDQVFLQTTEVQVRTMRMVYEAADRVEAQMLKDYLEAQGIVTVLLGDYLSGGAGELPANIFPALWVVKDEQYNRARWLIEEFSADPGFDSGAAWRCPVCGESVDPGFDICWNCASPRANNND